MSENIKAFCFKQIMVKDILYVLGYLPTNVEQGGSERLPQ